MIQQITNYVFITDQLGSVRHFQQLLPQALVRQQLVRQPVLRLLRLVRLHPQRHQHQRVRAQQQHFKL